MAARSMVLCPTSQGAAKPPSSPLSAVPTNADTAACVAFGAFGRSHNHILRAEASGYLASAPSAAVISLDFNTLARTAGLCPRRPGLPHRPHGSTRPLWGEP